MNGESLVKNEYEDWDADYLLSLMWRDKPWTRSPIKDTEEQAMTMKKFHLGTKTLHAGQVPDPTTGSGLYPLPDII